MSGVLACLAGCSPMSDAGAVRYVRVMVLVGMFLPLALLLSLIVDGTTGHATDDFIAFSVVGSVFLVVSAAAGLATMRGERAGAFSLGVSYVVLLITSFAVFVADMARPERTSPATTAVLVWFAVMVYLTGGMRAAYQRYQSITGQTTNYTSSIGVPADGEKGTTDAMVRVEDEDYGVIPSSSGTEYAY